MSKATPKDSGICFPRDAKGARSTSDAGKAIIGAAIRGSKAPDSEKLAAACEKERNWRFGYNKHFKNLVRVSAHSAAAALGAAEAGIAHMQKAFDFVEPGTTESVAFDKYLSSYKAGKGGFNTAVISGKTKRGGKSLTVNYKGKDLTGKPLQQLFQKWSDYGTIEPDAALSLISMCDGEIDLTNQHFVLIGAGSAMGPFYKLLEHGATVICIDIPGKWGERPAAMWQRLIDAARNSSGVIIFPLTGVTQNQCKDDAALIAAAGCNLTDMPATILDWLKNTAVGHSLCVGNYTYLDGDLHVKLALAADAIIEGLCKSRKDTKVAFLCTPTDLHVITDDAHKAAINNYGWARAGKIVELFFQVVSFGKFLKKNVCKPLPTSNPDKTLNIVDGLSVAQGPNYALAKRLQHWRAMVAYEAGHVVSSNVAPSTATLSVVSNRTFAWAYGGMPYFKPYEIFQQETTNGVMGGMLIYDATSAASAANPANRKKFGIANTLELFKWNSVHGGVWRAGYTVDSIGEVSVLIHFLGGPGAFLPVLTLMFGLVVLFYLKWTGQLA